MGFDQIVCCKSVIFCDFQVSTVDVQVGFYAIAYRNTISWSVNSHNSQSKFGPSFVINKFI